MPLIELPWPHKDLSPNARGHWSKRHRAVKKARADAYGATLAAGIRKVAVDLVQVTTTFFPPDRRNYDHDNLQARCKAYFDGIADAIGVDDKHFRHAPVQAGAPRKHGAVHVEIEVYGG